MKYDLNIIADYVSKGLVIGQAHATLPLAIFNYSRTCQYDRLWDDVTLNCRGLILDTDGNVVAKPFPKFFNYEEHTTDEIPNELFDVYEKMDGSLGICFYYNGEWYMATRGSFTSEQAIKGRELLERYDYKNGMIPGYTYLFEIIYPENRIVVDYGGAEKLVVLGAYNNETGNEVSVDEMANEGFEVVTRYNTFGEGFDELKREISNSKEGYVIRFRNGMRMKIKGDEYVRLHRILTNFSTKDIWELLKNGEPLEPFLDRVPDEFDVWVKEVVKDIQIRFENIVKDYNAIFWSIYDDDKKVFAERAHPSLLFSLYDKKNKSAYDYVWKLLKPKYEKPFKKDLDN
jgi:RNA ligase